MASLNPTRRSFLRRMAGGTAFLAAGASSLSELSSALVAATDPESYWEMIRWQFPFREDKVPMNAANLCPSPRLVAERVTELTRDIDVDCSFNNRAKFPRLQEESRSKLAAQLGVSPDEIALVRNTSEANNIVNNGFPLKPGDEVVLWDQNHPTNNVAWEVRAARSQFAVKRVVTPQDPSGADELIHFFEKAFTTRTRVLAITHVSNISGLQLPVRELCQVAHQRGIYVHVDGAQTWGALNVDLRELGCDSYAASAHKWFVGPKEVGLLYVKEGRIGQIWPNIVAPGWGNRVQPDLQGARKFESFGQRDDARLTAVGVTSDFHQLIGPARIESRVYELAKTLKAGLRELGAKLVSPVDPRLSAGVCVIQVPVKNRQLLFDTLYEQHGIAGSTAGGLRLCPHFYNTREHIERAIKGVKTMSHLIA